MKWYHRQAGYINELLTKKSLRDIISQVLKETAALRRQHVSLMILKILDFRWPLEEGLSFNLNDVIDSW
jgi:DNA-directed RNA polymerase subunit beta'